MPHRIEIFRRDGLPGTPGGSCGQLEWTVIAVDGRSGLGSATKSHTREQHAVAELALSGEGIGDYIMSGMNTGTVVRFDRAKGFGFVTPDDGGEDLFLHASVLSDGDEELISGARVRYSTIPGNRGLRAIGVELLPASAPPVASAPAASAPREPATSNTSPASAASPAPTSAAPARRSGQDDMCDVLSPAEYAQEITDVLIDELPTITGAQISRIRERILTAAEARGWVDD